MEEPFGLERLHREEKGMNHVVKTVVFMGKTFLLAIVLLCTAWCTVFVYCLVVYGLLESMVLAMGSIMLLAIIYGMIHHGKP